MQPPTVSWTPDRISPEITTSRELKYKQAAIVYLHIAILYEAAVYVFKRQDILPEARGPAWLWLLLGALLAGLITYALWRWQHRWLVLTVWALHSLRIPVLIEGAFFGKAHTFVDTSQIPPSFYLTALIVVLINLGFLARAGFDL